MLTVAWFQDGIMKKKMHPIKGCILVGGVFHPKLSQATGTYVAIKCIAPGEHP